jgi:HSP20 family protein
MLMRTDPFRELDRLTEQFFGGTSRTSVMHLDAFRDGEYFYTLFDLPGVDPDTIDVTVERNVLTVRAERPAIDRSGVDVVISERPTGTFTRQLFLGEALDPDQLDARYDNGVLTLRIPVAERAKPRRIEVTAGGGGPRQISS